MTPEEIVQNFAHIGELAAEIRDDIGLASASDVSKISSCLFDLARSCEDVIGAAQRLAEDHKRLVEWTESEIERLENRINHLGGAKSLSGQNRRIIAAWATLAGMQGGSTLLP